MNRRKVLGGLLVVALGGGLLGAFRGLSSGLLQIFPNLAHEERTALKPPVVLADDPFIVSQEPAPPAGATPVKLSGEETALNSLNSKTSEVSEKDGPGLRTSRRLVMPSRIPEIGIVRSVSESFEVVPELEPIVDFWRMVYGVWDSSQVVLHDTDYLEIQYSVLDFSDLRGNGTSNSERKDTRDAEIRSEMNRIRDALTELEQWNGLDPVSKDARHIAALFRHIGGTDKYKEAKERIRTQSGLKHRFAEGLRRSGRYMALFEKIFQSYGVPREITRLAFVESLFKERALSKVGAAGLWQFMPDTARRYMTVDRLIDERYDPVMAAHGAARLLTRNHELLGTWPLAINAYNSGPGNLLKAVSRLGTRDIGKIATNFRSGSYAFASRNFYPSFLAALEVYERSEKYFGRVHRDPPLQFDTLELPATMGFNEIAYLADVGLDDLKEVNPAFQPPVFEEDYALPAGTQVRVPSGRQSLFASRFVQYSSGMESPLFHVINPGESLHDIAGRYGLSSEELQRANTVERAERGRVLMIPSATSLVKN